MKKKLIPLLCILLFAGVALWLVAGKNIQNATSIGLILLCPLLHLSLGHGDHTHDHQRKQGEKI